MFCPVCKAEYRSGFTMCSDCHVALVQVVPTELKEEFIEYEEVMFTFHPADIAFIKSILDGEDIAYYFQGEQFNYGSSCLRVGKLISLNQYSMASDKDKGAFQGVKKSV